MNTLGERLRHARRLRGLTQQELSEKSNVKQGTISQIERGDQQQTSYGVPLAIALDIRPEWLATGRGPMSLENNTKGSPGTAVIDSVNEGPAAYNLDTALGKKWAKLTDKEKAMALAILDGIEAAREQ